MKYPIKILTQQRNLLSFKNEREIDTMKKEKRNIKILLLDKAITKLKQ